jgi:peptidoglycan/LPS O-acetylase OafA/YrhL
MTAPFSTKQVSELRPPNGVQVALEERQAAPVRTGFAQSLEIELAGVSSHQLKALHGLRFLAAFCILLGHSCTWLANFNDNDVIREFGGYFSIYGMPLFFVLSGFVIHYNYSRLFSTMRPSWAILEFLGARFARIYPLFLCFLLIGIAVDAMLQWLHHYKFTLLIVLAHALTLTQSWVYIVIFGNRLALYNGYGLSWSLSTELFFYLLYLVIVPHIVRLRRLSVLLMLAGIVSALAFAADIYGTSHREALTAFAARHMNDHFDQWDHSAYRWFFYYSPYVRMFEFIVGCLAAQVYARIAEKPPSPRQTLWAGYLLSASLIIIGAFGLIYSFKPFGPVISGYVDTLILNFACAIPIAVVVYCVSRHRSRIAAALSTPVMVLLGDLSYSVYTVHTWTLRIFERPPTSFRTGLAIEAIVRIVLAIALTIILSTATYSLIEVPARAWLRRAVKQTLANAFGPREKNMLPVARTYRRRDTTALIGAFILMMAGIVTYQFAVVPHFSPYTR